jgi:hypothetical protein
LVQHPTAQGFFEHGAPSILLSKHLVRTQAIIETLLWIGKYPAVIRNSCTFLLTLRFRIRTTRRADSLAPSAFPDHLQILPQFDPAAVWQEAAEIYAGINQAIAADDRAGIDD